MPDSGDAVDLDERSFNLESVELGDDDIDAQNGLIGEDRVGVDVGVEAEPLVDEERKKEFERQKDEILSHVPAEVKARFGEIYFSTFGKFTGPALVMDPYRVEPGPLRDQWIAMFHNVSIV